MAQFGKSASAKRSKPSYLYSIIGVALILFLFGILGLFFLNLRKSGDVFKEQLEINAYINPVATPKQKDSLFEYIKSLPYVKTAEFITKAKAIEIYNAKNDSNWKKLIFSNPLPESVSFFLKASHVNKDSLTVLNNQLMSTHGDIISEIQDSKDTVKKIGGFARYVSIGILIFAIIISVIVVISIDNTIRLAMYSNRFLIKTMQMVGATRWFIARPLNIRAIINGLIASGLAIAAVLGSLFLLEKLVPEMSTLRDGRSIVLVVAGILILGVSITLISTNRSILKYLKMKLDDLY
jgi:cell division transport system permease protein